MRINAQLVDAQTGAHLWADRFDKSVADLLATQHEIVARIAGQLNTALVTAEVGSPRTDGGGAGGDRSGAGDRPDLHRRELSRHPDQ